MRDKIPTNVDVNGCAVCLKSNYYKMGIVNFLPQIGGGKYAATGVMEIVYEQADSLPPLSE
jgi:hypothetical protein